MKADFKGHGRIETLLEKHIPKYDNSLSTKMLLEAGVLKDQIQRFVIPTEPESFTIKDFHGETAYWEINFTQPVIVYVPECFRFITQNVLYHYEKGLWLEHVPSYIPNINHVAMFTNYNNGSREFENNSDGLLKKYVHVNNRPMTFSSLNILQKWYSKPSYLDDSIHDYVKKSFEYCYWRLPTRSNQDDGSCINNLIYATTSKVQDVLILRKTLVKILEIEPRKEERALLEKNHNYHGRFAKVLVLYDDGEKISSEERRIFLLEHIAENIKVNDIINSVIVQIGTQKNRRGTVMIGKIGKTVEPNNTECVLSIVLSKMLQTFEDDSSPTKITTKEKIEFEITKLFQENFEMFDAIFGWGKDIPKKVSKSIETLFPIFVQDGDDIYQLSTVMMTFLCMTAPEELQKKNSLVLRVKLFDKMKVNSNFWGIHAMMKLRTSDNYEEIQKTAPSLANQLLKMSPRLVNRIVYSRILSQHFTHWN